MITIDGEEFPWREGLTISKMLVERDDTYDYAVVRMNQMIVSRPNFKSAVIPNHAEIVLIPMVAGG